MGADTPTTPVADARLTNRQNAFARLLAGLNLKSRLKLVRWFINKVRKVVIAGALFITAVAGVNAAPAAAADINVGGACTLADAITAANTDMPAGSCPAGSGTDNINVPPGLPALTAPLPIINSDINFIGQGAGAAIDGGSTHRIFFIGHDGTGIGTGSPTVTFTDLTLQNGYAKGGDSGFGGAGAGMGGAAFIYNGNVTFTNSTFNGNKAQGGSYANGAGNTGGGIGVPNRNPANDGAPGGNPGNPGGYGGNGGTGAADSTGGNGGFGGAGGEGGPSGFGGAGGNGGFGGGGGTGGDDGDVGFGGKGGFGGGGGSGFYGSDGDGGFGGGGGFDTEGGADGGYGGGDAGAGSGGGAGFGGALFVHAGTVTFDGAVAFTSNMATGGLGGDGLLNTDDGEGRGGAVFVCTNNLGPGSESCGGAVQRTQCSTVAFVDNMGANGQNDMFVRSNNVTEVPEQVPAMPCARLEITKVTVPAGVDQDFEFTVGAESVTLNASSAPSGDLTLFPELVSVSETEVEGWVLTDANCGATDSTLTGTSLSVTLPASGELTACTFTNTLTFELEILKTVFGPPSTPATFSITATDPAACEVFDPEVSQIGAGTTTATVQAGADGGAGGVTACEYTVTETNPGDGCTALSGSQTVSNSGPVEFINVCPTPQALTIAKTWIGVPGPAIVFDVAPATGAPTDCSTGTATIAAGAASATATVNDISPTTGGSCTYTVTEPTIAGYTATATTVDVSAGTGWTAEFTNQQNPSPVALQITKTWRGATGGDIEFTVTPNVAGCPSNTTTLPSGQTTVDADVTDISTINATPCTYTVTEHAIAGYTADVDVVDVSAGTGWTADFINTQDADPLVVTFDGLSIEDPYICGQGFTGSIAGGLTPYTVSYTLTPNGGTPVTLPTFDVAAAGDYFTPDGYIDHDTFDGPHSVTVTVTDFVGNTDTTTFDATLTTNCEPPEPTATPTTAPTPAPTPTPTPTPTTTGTTTVVNTPLFNPLPDAQTQALLGHIAALRDSPAGTADAASRNAATTTNNTGSQPLAATGTTTAGPTMAALTLIGTGATIAAHLRRRRD